MVWRGMLCHSVLCVMCCGMVWLMFNISDVGSQAGWELQGKSVLQRKPVQD
jgi:hypothetical protein